MKSSTDAPAPQGFRSLLVPVDLTPGTDRILGRIALLPLCDDARVTLVHVVPGSFPTSEQRRAERDAAKALSGYATDLRGMVAATVTVKAIVTTGGAAEEIAARAAEAHAEIIVMGRRHGRILRDAILGSTAERVVRHAQLPVLVVRLPARAAYHRPALALDLDQTAHEVVRVMLRVLPEPGLRVEVVHAFDVPFRTLIYPSFSRDEADEKTSELRADAIRTLLGLLDASLTEAGVRAGEGPLWRPHVRQGSPRSVVEKVTKQFDTDLLVLGTHGYTGAANVLLGSVAGDLLRAAKCDVLVVPPPAPPRASRGRAATVRGGEGA